MSILAAVTSIFSSGVIAIESDQNGLAAIRPEVEAGIGIPPFKFFNGNRLKLTLDNWEDFRAVWLPFRMSFF